MPKVRYEEMLPEEFLDAAARMPVFMVPLGLLEWHADHLPLGQDGLKAHGICLRLAERLGGGIVLPPVYFGRPGFSTYTGTLTFSEALVNLMLTELCSQLKGGREGDRAAGGTTAPRRRSAWRGRRRHRAGEPGTDHPRAPGVRRREGTA